MESVTKINVDSYSSNKGLHHTKIETILTHWSEAGSNDETKGVENLIGRVLLKGKGHEKI